MFALTHLVNDVCQCARYVLFAGEPVAEHPEAAAATQGCPDYQAHQGLQGTASSCH